MVRWGGVALIAAYAAVASACLEHEEARTTGCTDCHGSATSPAPPNALGDFAATERAGVGAHRAHLENASISRKVACSECHLVPATVDAPGHIDTPWPAEVKWGELSKTGTAAPAWDRSDLTCSNVYCHGATLGGGSNSVPLWTRVDGTQIACGSCHATPPPPPHPPESNCGMCHAPTAGEGATIADAETHIDGIVQVVRATPCGGCHGDGTSLAPDLGAHRAHTSGGRFSKAVACGDCHVVPATVEQAGHIDPAPAEVSFSGLALKDSSAAFSADTKSCSSTYCHATASRGGTEPVPDWDAAGGIQCGACHAIPPPAPHPAASSCGCHSNIGPNLTIRNPALHVDGFVNF